MYSASHIEKQKQALLKQKHYVQQIIINGFDLTYQTMPEKERSQLEQYREISGMDMMRKLDEIGNSMCELNRLSGF